MMGGTGGNAYATPSHTTAAVTASCGCGARRDNDAITCTESESESHPSSSSTETSYASTLRRINNVPQLKLPRGRGHSAWELCSTYADLGSRPHRGGV